MSSPKKTVLDRNNPEKSGTTKNATGSSPVLKSGVEMLECDIPAELPIIPLASTVVFPQMVVNLQVVRKKNLNLIRDMEQESIIGLFLKQLN